MKSSSNPARSPSSSSADYSQSAIIFSRSLLQFIDGRQCRLPTTYIGVQRQGEDPSSTSSPLPSRRTSSSSRGQGEPSTNEVVVGSSADGLKEVAADGEDDDDDNDSWVVPTHEIMTASYTGTTSGAMSSPVLCDSDQHDNNNNDDEGGMNQEQTKVAPIIYRIPTNLDDKTTTTATVTTTISTTGRRMTTREKKQLKYQVKQAQHAVRKEERQRLHEERISTAKKEKAERKRLKKLAWQSKLHEQVKDPQEPSQEESETKTVVQQMHISVVGKSANATIMCRSSTVEEFPKKEEKNTQSHELGKDGDRIIIPNKADAPATSTIVITASQKGGVGTTPALFPLPTPAMLTPAATCLARDKGMLLTPYNLREQHVDASSTKTSSTTTSRLRRRRTSILDPILSEQWAKQLLNDALIPADISRSKEEMRPMAYRIVPEVWKRLCPDSLWTTLTSASVAMEENFFDDDDDVTANAAVPAYPTTSQRYDKKGGASVNGIQTQIHGSSTGEGTTTTTLSTIATTTNSCYYSPCHDDEYSLARLRHPCSSSTAATSSASSNYDEDAYLIFQHLHQHSTNLHIACGALFGCDFLLYDGHRDERHSFAGLRIYCCNSRRSVKDSTSGDGEEEKDEVKKNRDGIHNDQLLPIPSAYDMAGFVRTMNSARKIALLATVVREEVQHEEDHGEGGEDDANSSPQPPRRMTTTSSKPSYRIAIVDLALEKVLTAPTHIRKGNTKKRRSEDDAANGLAKRKF